jgi:hypothetical protein
VIDSDHEFVFSAAIAASFNQPLQWDGKTAVVFVNLLLAQPALRRP